MPRAVILLGCLLLIEPALAIAQFKAASTSATKPGEIIVGIEYAFYGPAKTFAEIGVPAAKYYPDEITWGKMQSGPEAKLDFRLMDRFVREYHEAGFTDLMLALKSNCAWGCIGAGLIAPTNLAPKPEHRLRYAAWVQSVVERYDHDGKDDMPGLRRPVQWFEVGSEFSSFEPEPIADYLPMLELAYTAAHAASKNVKLLHTAFLTTTAFRDHPKPGQYEKAFADAAQRTTGRIFHKSLTDIRAVLNHPEWFDALNFHAIGDALEIEDTAEWLRWEMKQRGYEKLLICSDTTPSPLIAWGPATRATGPVNTLGVVVPPATEQDRPRLATYFTKLIDGDPETVQWTHAFVAADMIKKVVVAAEQRIAWINTSFMEDLTLLKAKPLAAGAGTSAWAGMAETKLNLLDQSRTIVSLRPVFYSVQQVQKHIRGYEKIERVPHANVEVRLYKVSFAKGPPPVWIAWLEPKRIVLPGENAPTVTISLKVDRSSLSVEPMINRAGVAKPSHETITVEDGMAQVNMSLWPVFVLAR